MNPNTRKVKPEDPDTFPQCVLAWEMENNECEWSKTLMFHNGVVKAIKVLKNTPVCKCKEPTVKLNTVPCVKLTHFCQFFETHDILDMHQSFHCDTEDLSMEELLKRDKDHLCTAWPEGKVPLFVMQQFNLAECHLA